MTLLLAVPFVAEAKPISIQVKGMVCAFCAQGIEKKFGKMPQIDKVSVDLDTKLVSLETKDGQDISDDDLKKIIVESGYEVVKIERKK